MQFTKEEPKETGWYWLKPDPEHWPGLPEEVQKPQMVAVHKWNDKFWFEDTVNREEYECPAEGRLWAGPLTPDTPSMRALLEKALPIIEAEAERREQSGLGFGDQAVAPYWREMRDLANEIAAILQ